MSAAMRVLWCGLCACVGLSVARADGGQFGPEAWACAVLQQAFSSQEESGPPRCSCAFHADESGVDRTALHCADKGFESLSVGERLPYHVSSLDLSRNHIHHLTAGLFDRTRPLQRMVIARNGLLQIDERALAGLVDLRYLDLSHNNMVSLPEHLLANLTALRHLDLSWNELQYLPAPLFWNVSRLDTLSLSGNPHLAKYIHGYPDALKDVLAKGLRRLKLNNLNLSSIPENVFNEAAFLEELEIAHNRFKKLPELFVGSLQVLNISATDIARIEPGNFLYLPSLREIHMNRMRFLTHIDEGAFVGLKHLEELFVEKCFNLTSFDGLAFGAPNYSKPPLRVLSLRNSGLQTLSKKLLAFFSTIHTLRLQGNPWDCSCRLRWFKELNFTEESQHHVRCFFPPALRNRTVSSLPAPAFSCTGKRASLLFPLMVALASLLGLLALLAVAGCITTLRRKHFMRTRTLACMHAHRIRYDPMRSQHGPGEEEEQDSDYDSAGTSAISFIRGRD